MKYIEADKIKAEIDTIINGLNRSCNPNPLGTIDECMAAAEIEALRTVKDIIDNMKQEEPTHPSIDEESKTKDWLYNGLMVTDADIPTDDEVEDTMRMLKKMNNRKQI